MKFSVKLTILIFILIVNNIYTNIPLKLYIDFTRTEKHINIDEVKIEINSKQNKLSFNWDSINREPLTSEIKKGKYILFVILRYNNTTDSVNYEFEVIGNEKDVFIYVACLADSINAKFDEIIVQKTFSAPIGLRIHNKFKFKINDEPEFILLNNTNKYFYAHIIHNYFWGDIYELINKKWIMVNNRSVCASYEENNSPLNPGDSVTATILPSYFYKDRFKFEHKGKYKFSIDLCETKHSFGFRIVKPYTQFSTRIIYNLEYEFNLD